MRGKTIRVGQIVPSSDTTMESEIPKVLRARQGVGPERGQAAQRPNAGYRQTRPMQRELARERWNNMTTRTYAEPSREQAEAIAGNVRLLTEAFTDLSGESLPPGRAGVVFLDGFINRQRKHGDEAQRDKLADMAACYLGEALIVEIGGRWVQDPENGLGVELAPKLVVFPLAKAAKHFAYGTEDSVLSFFEVAELLAAKQRRAAPN